MDRDGVWASIQYARHNSGWVAEFRFALRAGLCWACTLPLTTSSEQFATEAAALGHAARRMLDSLSAALDGDALSKAQQKSVDALVAWTTEFLAAAPPANAKAEPLAGKRFLDTTGRRPRHAIATRRAVVAKLRPELRSRPIAAARQQLAQAARLHPLLVDVLSNARH